MGDSIKTPAIAILALHSLDDMDSPLSFPPSLFESGMRDLHARGYRSITVREASRMLSGSTPWPEKTIALTFDDGYVSVLEQALPVLQETGFRATVFLNTGGSAHGELPVMEGRKRLSWTQVRQLHEAGVEIGAHTESHPDLTRLPEARIEAEMTASRMAIEDAIGERVASFAYPFGFHNEATRSAARRQFECACAGDLGLVSPSSDPWALERVEMHYFNTPATFRLLHGPRLSAYLALRRAPRLVRQAAQRLMWRSGE
jgi:peptidoglycan/xylan/chitin deacetylase (PgdA/CDA1 family)